MGKKYIKYIIEIPEDKITDFVGSTHFLMPYMIARHIGHHDTGLPIEPYTEPDLGALAKENFERGYRQRKAEDEKEIQEVYQRGLSDAWEAARKIASDNAGRNYSIFGQHFTVEILNTHSASECIEKIRQYEQEQIQVGDEVIPRETEYDTMIVTRLWKDDYDSDCIDAIGFDGRISSFLVSRVSKTGKHYEIAEVLAKMKESEGLMQKL